MSEVARTSLWDLEQQLVELVEFRESVESDEERIAADSAIAEYIRREVSKVDGIRAYIRHCETMIAGAKEESKRQGDRKEAWERRLEAVKRSVFQVMEATGKKKLEGATGYFAIRGNGGKIPVIIEDDLLIPSSLCDLIKTPRRDDVRQKLESGELVPGARLGERGTRLEVK